MRDTVDDAFGPSCSCQDSWIRSSISSFYSWNYITTSNPELFFGHTFPISPLSRDSSRIRWSNLTVASFDLQQAFFPPVGAHKAWSNPGRLDAGTRLPQPFHVQFRINAWSLMECRDSSQFSFRWFKASTAERVSRANSHYAILTKIGVTYKS